MRRASLLLSGLVLTADDSLDAFRERRAAGSEVDLEQLKRARDLLDAVHQGIASGGAEQWERLDAAWRAVQPGSVPAAAPASAAAPAQAPALTPAVAAAPVVAVVASVSAPMPAAPALAAPAVAAPALAAPALAAPALAAPALAAPALATPALAIARPVVGLAVAASPPAAAPPVTDKPVSPPTPAQADTAPVPSSGGAVPPASATPDDLSGATMPDAEDGDGRTVLPFTGRAVAPPSALADMQPVIYDALAQTCMQDGPLKGITLPFGPPLGALLPPDLPPLPPHLSSLSLEHYASLCAERDVYKGWEAQVEARYGLTGEGDRDAVAAHFQAQMKANREVMATWRKRYADVESWARKQQRRGG
jgi:hypothetical protein